MKRVIWMYAALLAVSLTALAAGGKQSAQLSEDDKKQIRERAQQFEKAWNDKDMQAVGKLYTEDATMMMPTGQELKGRQMIREGMGKSQKEQFQGMQMELTVAEIIPLAPNLALVDIEQEFTPVGSQGQPQQKQKVLSTAILTKEGDTWMAKAVRARPDPEQMKGVGGAGMDPQQLREQCEQLMQQEQAPPTPEPMQPMQNE